MLLEHRKLLTREVRGPAITAARLGAELGDVLAMVIDHVAPHLTIEGRAAEMPKLCLLRTGLRHDRVGGADMHLTGKVYDLRLCLRVIGDERVAKVPD
jgi:hypothetical protein